MKNSDALLTLSRYFVLVLLGFFGLKLFYAVLTPLTVYPVYWIASALDSGATLFPADSLIFFHGLYARIIPACVAGAAYYLLLIFNLVTPMKPGQRTKSILFLIFAFLILNIARIIVFIALAVSGYQYFDVAHRFVWYFGSTVFVVLLWFLNVWLFKIREIPIYSDMRNLFGEVSGRKRWL